MRDGIIHREIKQAGLLENVNEAFLARTPPFLKLILRWSHNSYWYEQSWPDSSFSCAHDQPSDLGFRNEGAFLRAEISRGMKHLPGSVGKINEARTDVREGRGYEGLSRDLFFSSRTRHRHCLSRTWSLVNSLFSICRATACVFFFLLCLSVALQCSDVSWSQACMVT